jgi:hypothetical protein
MYSRELFPAEPERFGRQRLPPTEQRRARTQRSDHGVETPLISDTVQRASHPILVGTHASAHARAHGVSTPRRRRDRDRPNYLCPCPFQLYYLQTRACNVAVPPPKQASVSIFSSVVPVLHSFHSSAPYRVDRCTLRPGWPRARVRRLHARHRRSISQPP